MQCTTPGWISDWKKKMLVAKLIKSNEVRVLVNSIRPVLLC